VSGPLIEPDGKVLAKSAEAAEAAEPDELQPSRLAMERALLVIGDRTEVVLVRHAQQVRTLTEAHRAGGQPLSDLGRQQAAFTASQLALESFTAVYCSDLNRAMETADVIAAQVTPGVEPVVIGDLREVDMFSRDRGGFQITPESQLEAGEKFIRTLQWSSYPATESGRQLRARIRGVVEKLVTDHAGERICVVSHGGAIATFVADLVGARPDMIFFPGHASISRVFHGDGRFVTHSLNEVSHLRDQGALTF
jgi:broad specificity phosphatase PhoE